MTLILKKKNQLLFYSSDNMLATWAKYHTLKIGFIEKSTFLFSCVRMACMPIYVYCVGVYAHLEPRVFYLLY